VSGERSKPKRSAGCVFLAVLVGVGLHAASYTPPAPEINVERPSGVTIPDGGTDAQGNCEMHVQVAITYTVRNAGTAALGVTDIVGSGPNGVTISSISPTAFDLGVNETQAVESSTRRPWRARSASSSRS